MEFINAQQGSQEWLDARAKRFTASEAPAMMGQSKYTSRQDLLRQKHTGLVAEVDSGKQRLFDRGHEAEALARPIVEGIIGAELFPATGTLDVDGLPLLASFDGLTMLGELAWENKLWNVSLADQVRAGQLEPHYYWQLEQQLLVSDAQRAYFTTSDGTPENTVGMLYESQPERRSALIAGWKQFAEDLANYQHVEAAPKPVAAVIEALPALVVQVEGRVLSTNLDAFKAKAQAFIEGIKTELASDQDFADAEQMVKFLKDGEEKLALAKQQALAQTASIDELFRAVDAIGEQMRAKRLALDKLVKSEKENRKAALITAARQAIEDHVAKLNKRLGGNWMPQASAAPFADAIRGLKSLDSMRDKVAGALANEKIRMSAIADTIEENRKSLANDVDDWMFLFPDFALVCTKSREDFAAMLFQRRQQDEKRKEDERARAAAAQAVDDARKATESAMKETAALVAAANDQGGKADAGMGVEHPARAQPDVASTPPIQSDDAMIDDFIALLPLGAVEKKALRQNIQKWERYRVARSMQEAA